MISRRHFLGTSLGALAGAALPACHDLPTAPVVRRTGPRLTARPTTPTVSPTLGLSDLGLGFGRDGVLYVPEGYDPDLPTPLFVALHGAGGSGSSWESYPARAEARGMVFLAPDSRSATWDLPTDGTGADVEFLDRALAHVFERCRIDPGRIALGGFSDGGSWALSAGVSNGDLFACLVGYSPGYLLAANPLVGSPRIYVSHGTQDRILPVSGSRDIVTVLEGEGYDVTFHEFAGGHAVPPEISAEALDWFLGR